MRYDIPIHPIPIGSIIKYNVREYGYFYGDGQEKRAITIAKIGKVIDIIVKYLITGILNSAPHG